MFLIDFNTKEGYCLYEICNTDYQWKNYFIILHSLNISQHTFLWPFWFNKSSSYTYFLLSLEYETTFLFLWIWKAQSLYLSFLYYLYGTQNREEKCLLCAHKKDLFFSFFAFYSSTNGKISATKARVTTLTLLFFFTSSFQVPMGKKPQGILHFFSFIYMV